MATYGVDAIYSSPLQRAYNTGMAIARITGHEIVVIDDLQEINEPLKEGSRRPGPERAAARRRDASRHQGEVRGGPDLGQPAGQRIERALPRAHRAVRSTRSSRTIPGKKVAITCHGGVIQSYVAQVLGLRSDFPFYCFNASITSVRAQGDRRALWRLNDLGHLDGMAMT